MAEEKASRSFAAHDGTFHADEVSACALLLLSDLIDRDKIVRTRDPKRLAQCEFVCDVGGIYDPKQKLFDHHQVDYIGSYSSAGMVLQWLRDDGHITEAAYEHLNNSVIIGIDDHDNGRAPIINGYCTVSHVVANYNPVNHDCSEEERNAAFIEALDFVLGHLRRLMERFDYIQSCRAKVQDCMQAHTDCLIFEESLPWIENFFELGGEQHPALFLIMPSGDHWKLRSIPPTYEDRMSCRMPLPQEWAGLLEKDFEQVCKIPGAMFCHKGRFISVWETKEAALEALKYTLSQREDEHGDRL